MIGYLHGKPKVIDTKTLLVDVNGVGYRVIVPARILQAVGEKDTVRLWIHTHVKKEIFDLFGFLKQEELHLFKLLLNISGIGPRTALVILDHDIDTINKAIIEADIAFFTSIPRLSKKNAQRIIIELKPKLGGLKEFDLRDKNGGETQQVIAALVNMGFTGKEAHEAIREISADITGVKNKVKEALRVIGN